MSEIINQSGRAHKRVQLLLQQRGIEGIDPESDEGKIIIGKALEYQSIATDLPEAAVKKYVQMAVEAELLKNSSFTSLIKIKDIPTGSTDNHKAKRDAYRLAMGAYKNYVSLILSIMKALMEKDEVEARQEDLFSQFDKLKKTNGVPEEKTKVKDDE